MAAKGYKFSALTGGGAGALDLEDGTSLLDGDFAIVILPTGLVYNYILDEDSGLAEASPSVIAPDANAGDKRWIRALSADAIGGNQTWQEVLFDRSVNTVFQNTTGSPIQVCVTMASSSGGAGSSTFMVGSTSTPSTSVGFINFPAGSGFRSGFSVIVPDNDYYKVATSGNIILAGWAELK